MTEQLKIQNKIASANLVFKLLEHWKEDSAFTQILLEIEKPNVKFTNENYVHYMLATFEDMAVLREDGMLTEDHIRNFFGRDIVRIGVNESIMKILNEYYEEDTANNYNNLVKLIDDSKNWGLSPYSSKESSSVTS